MPKKNELYQMLDTMGKTAFTKGDVKSFIQSVTEKVESPVRFKKGDVILHQTGVKMRPNVVIRAQKDVLYAIALSTTEDEMNLCVSRSRFFRDGWFSKGIVVISVDHAKDYFAGVYDNPKLLNKAIKLTKEEINKL